MYLNFSIVTSVGYDPLWFLSCLLSLVPPRREVLKSIQKGHIHMSNVQHLVWLFHTEDYIIHI